MGKKAADWITSRTELAEYLDWSERTLERYLARYPMDGWAKLNGRYRVHREVAVTWQAYVSWESHRHHDDVVSNRVTFTAFVAKTRPDLTDRFRPWDPATGYPPAGAPT